MIHKQEMVDILKRHVDAVNMGVSSDKNMNKDPRAEYACYNRQPLPASGSSYDRPLLYEINLYSRSPIMGDDEDSQEFFIRIEADFEAEGEMMEWNQEYNTEEKWWHAYASVEVKGKCSA